MKNTKIVGNLGEDIASGFLMKQGFSVISRNYLRKWGEIDIVCQKGKTLHFIEVKSVSCKTFDTREENGYFPEENVTPLKLARLRKVIVTYLADTHLPNDCEFYFHVACVYLNFEKRVGRVRMIWNLLI